MPVGKPLRCTVDVNESDFTGDDAVCDNATCENIPGSYECTCLMGYSGTPCTDNNECTDDLTTPMLMQPVPILMEVSRALVMKALKVVQTFVPTSMSALPKMQIRTADPTLIVRIPHQVIFANAQTALLVYQLTKKTDVKTLMNAARMVTITTTPGLGTTVLT